MPPVDPSDETSPDTLLLQSLAARVLGSSSVATVTAKTIDRYGFDTNRVAGVVSRPGVVMRVGEFEFKKIESDPETPADYGLLVRRKSRLKDAVVS